MRKLLVLIILLCLSEIVTAQGDMLIPCDGAPAEAVMKLPEPLGSWGALYCTKYGHSIAAKEQWIWSFPGAFAPVHIPAQMVRSNPKEIGHAAFFKNIQLIELKGDSIIDAQVKFKNSFIAEWESPIAAAYRLILVNQADKNLEILFLITEDDIKDGRGHWALWCKKECQDGTPFMLLNYEGQEE
jgi:hypothetical protein